MLPVPYNSIFWRIKSYSSGVVQNLICSVRFRFGASACLRIKFIPPNCSLGKISRALHHGGTKALLAAVDAPPAQAVVAAPSPVVQEQRPFVFQFLAHSRHRPLLSFLVDLFWKNPFIITLGHGSPVFLTYLKKYFSPPLKCPFIITLGHGTPKTLNSIWISWLPPHRYTAAKNLLFSHSLSIFFAAPAFLGKVPHNTTVAKRAKNGTKSSKNFSLTY